MRPRITLPWQCYTCLHNYPGRNLWRHNGIAVGLILTLEKTSLKSLGMVAALIAASLLVPLFGWESVAQVSDIADIPGSLPRPPERPPRA